MSETSGHPLSVAGLFAARDARGRHDQEALEQLQRRKEEELAEFRKRLDNFQLTDAITTVRSKGKQIQLVGGCGAIGSGVL